MSRTPLATAIVLVLALLALTACGGEDDQATVAEPGAEAAQGARAEAEGQEGSFAVELLRGSAVRAAAALREQADSLEDADAPALLQEARDRLAETLRDLADRLEREAENVDAGDVDRLLDALRDAGVELPGAAAP